MLLPTNAELRRADGAVNDQAGASCSTSYPQLAARSCAGLTVLSTSRRALQPSPAAHRCERGPAPSSRRRGGTPRDGTCLRVRVCKRTAPGRRDHGMPRGQNAPLRAEHGCCGSGRLPTGAQESTQAPSGDGRAVSTPSQPPSKSTCLASPAPCWPRQPHVWSTSTRCAAASRSTTTLRCCTTGTWATRPSRSAPSGTTTSGGRTSGRSTATSRGGPWRCSSCAPAGGRARRPGSRHCRRRSMLPTSPSTPP